MEKAADIWEKSLSVIKKEVGRSVYELWFEPIKPSLLDNGKINVRNLLDHMEELLKSQHKVRSIIRLKKPDASRPVTPEVIDEMKGCEAVISAVGD